MCYFIKKYARGRPNELAHGTIKTEYARAPRRLRVWQRLFLALGFGFVLMLLGTAVVDFDRRPADTAAAGGSGWAEPVYGYVLAGEGEVDVPLYTEGLGPMTECGRGVTVELESWEPFIADDGSEYYHVWYGGRYGYIAVDNIAASPERVLRESQVYVRTATNLLASPDDLALTDYVEKGMALNVLSYDYLEDDGSAHMYEVKYGDSVGWIRSDYTALSFRDAMENWTSDENSYASHASRGDPYGGGDPKDLDYFPRDEADFSADGNTMPDACYCLYIPAQSKALNNIDRYLELAEGTEINTFVFTISDNYALACPFETINNMGILSAYSAQLTADDFAAVVGKVRDAGYYIVARIVTFQDSALANAFPALAYGAATGGVQLMGDVAWPSLFSREVWRIKTSLAVEAVERFGFNEVMFDYLQSPYGIDNYEGADLRNLYGETRAQALQRFLMYAADALHNRKAYISAVVYGESAEPYVTNYGQYWDAFSTVVDVMCAAPYPESYANYWTSNGYYRPYQHPYSILSGWAVKVNRRQAECSSPAKVRTWIQTWDEAAYTYDNAAIEREILGLYDNGITDGYAPWSYYGDLDAYTKMLGVFRTDYYGLWLEAQAQGQKLSEYMGVSTSDAQDD